MGQPHSGLPILGILALALAPFFLPFALILSAPGLPSQTPAPVSGPQRPLDPGSLHPPRLLASSPSSLKHRDRTRSFLPRLVSSCCISPLLRSSPPLCFSLPLCISLSLCISLPLCIPLLLCPSPLLCNSLTPLRRPCCPVLDSDVPSVRICTVSFCSVRVPTARWYLGGRRSSIAAVLTAAVPLAFSFCVPWPFILRWPDAFLCLSFCVPFAFRFALARCVPLPFLLPPCGLYLLPPRGLYLLPPRGLCPLPGDVCSVVGLSLRG